MPVPGIAILPAANVGDLCVAGKQYDGIGYAQPRYPRVGDRLSIFYSTEFPNISATADLKLQLQNEIKSLLLAALVLPAFILCSADLAMKVLHKMRHPWHNQGNLI